MTTICSRRTFAIGAGLAPLAGVTPSLAEPDLVDLMRRNYLSQRYLTSRARARFRLIAPSGSERVRRVLSFSRLSANGIDASRITWFLDPPDVKGMGTLTIENSDGDDDIWVYLPAIRQTRRIQASSKGEAFLGTDFSYGDVLGYRVDQWDHRVAGEETIDGRIMTVIDSTARTPAIATGARHDKRTQWIDTETAVTRRVETFMANGTLLKKIELSKVSQVQEDPARFQPMLARAHNVDTGHITEVEYEDLVTGVDHPDGFFQVRALERGPP